MSDTSVQMTFQERCTAARKEIKEIAAGTLALKAIAAAEGPRDAEADGADANKGEMAANVALAYRHLEDAAMRLGKAIQAWDGGVSIYDK